MKDTDQKQRVLLVDDHPIVCEGLAQRISSEPDLVVCGQARDVPTALEAIARLRPDIAIVDIALGNGASGVELIKDIKVRYPQLPVLALSMHDESLYAERSLRAGAKGYVMKQEDPEVLLRAIREVLHRRVYLSERVKDAIVNRLGGNPPPGELTTPIDQLSDRELEIFQLLGDGYATEEIASRLHISKKTVASHRDHLKHKLNLPTGQELLRFAIHWQRHGGTTADQPPPTPDTAVESATANRRSADRPRPARSGEGLPLQNRAGRSRWTRPRAPHHRPHAIAIG